MYRLIVESLLGLKRRGNQLSINTRLPADWPQVTLNYREGGSEYQLIIRQGTGTTQITVDGEEQPEAVITLVDDGKIHHVDVMLGQ